MCPFRQPAQLDYILFTLADGLDVVNACAGAG